MKLSYVDILGDGERHEVNAEITTDHAASSYSQPVIVLEDGGLLDPTSWALMGYQVIEADEAEQAMLDKWLSLLDLLGG